MTITYIGRQDALLPEDALDLYNLHPIGTTFGAKPGATMDEVLTEAARCAKNWLENSPKEGE